MVCVPIHPKSLETLKHLKDHALCLILKQKTARPKGLLLDAIFFLYKSIIVDCYVAVYLYLF